MSLTMMISIDNCVWSPVQKVGAGYPPTAACCKSSYFNNKASPLNPRHFFVSAGLFFPLRECKKTHQECSGCRELPTTLMPLPRIHSFYVSFSAEPLVLCPLASAKPN